MHLVMAILRPGQVEPVRAALAQVQVTRLTICDAHGFAAPPAAIAQEAVMEIAVNDDFLERTVATLAAVLEAAGDAAGRLFVMPMLEAVQIYREVRGPEAI